MACERRRERGAVAVFVAISLLVLFGFMALSMNVGHGRAVRGQLQNAADAGALAAARELDGTVTPLTNGEPERWAVEIAGRHETDRDESVVVDRVQDVELGWWDPFGTDPATSFYPLNGARFAARWPLATTIEAQARIVNAVHVTALRTEDRGNPVGAWFGKLVNKETMDIGADAVACNGGPCDSCPNVPLAFFDCGMYVEEVDGLQCWKSLTFHYEMSPDPTDTVGFTSLSPDASANTDVYRRILECNGDPACCETLNINTQEGQEIAVSNGNQLNPLCGDAGFNQFCHADAQGNCRDAPKIVAPVVAGDCALVPPKFNQAHRVVGFATFQMKRLVCQGPQKFMEFEFLCGEVTTAPTRFGCMNWGTGPQEPRLVR